jgi:hypothetical protein
VASKRKSRSPWPLGSQMSDAPQGQGMPANRVSCHAHRPQRNRQDYRLAASSSTRTPVLACRIEIISA